MKYLMCIAAVIFTLGTIVPRDGLTAQIKCRCCALLAGVCFILAAALEILG